MAENRRGGRRSGRPGAKYPNRSDLALSPRTAPSVAITGQGYGKVTANAQTQAVVSGASSAARAASPTPTIPRPGGVALPPVDLFGPTDDPNEPVTAGLSMGPGPGPEALGHTDAPSLALRSWLIEHPFDEDVRQVIEILESEGR